MEKTVWNELPKKWKLDRIGSLYEVRNQKVSDYEYKPLSVTKEGIVPQLVTAAKTNAHEDRKLVKNGDFVINSRSDRRGSCGISKYDGSVSLINTVLKPRENMDPEYYGWLFHSSQFADEFYKWGHGIVDDLWTTGWQEMKKIRIPVPSLPEQKNIASYLNEKCLNIDDLKKDIEHQIEMLEEYKKVIITEAVTNGLNLDVDMKESGIQWIGKYPKKWKLIRLKYASLIKGRIGWQGLRTDEYHYEENLPYLITGTDFDKGIINWNTCAHVTEDRFKLDKNIQINENDLLITKDGTIGKTAIVKNCPEKVCLNSGVFIVRNIRKYKYVDKYLYYVLQSNQFTKWFDYSNAGNSTIKHLNQENFYNFVFTYPEISEQKEIVNFLDKKCDEIQSIIYDKKQQLDILTDYKKSLIYEYVTGKKEVEQ